MSFLDRLASCRGMDAPAIAAAFGDAEQDDVTRELLSVIAERTHMARLPRLPFAVRHTLYGDLDVSDWVIRYADGGAAVETGGEAAQADVTLRWEHWEDLIRLMNGDASEVALFFSRRVASEDDEREVVAWTSAVDFIGTGDPDDRPGALMNSLRMASAAGPDALDAFISEKGLPRLLAARSANMASSVEDVGAAEGLRGSYTRLVISTDPPVAVETTFPPDGSRASTRVLDGGEVGAGDPEGGVTLRFESVDAFVNAVTFKEDMPAQLASGALRVDGSPKWMMAFSDAMMALLHAPRPSIR